MKLSIIIVNHKSRDYLTCCIESIHSLLDKGVYEIIVVNNDREDLSFIQNEYVRVVQGGLKMGFGQANNLGAKHASAPFLWFLNPDTELLSANMEALLAALDDPGVGAIGMKLLDGKKNPQEWSCGFEITPLGIILNNFGFNKSKKLWGSSQSKEVSWVSGCSFAVNKELFQRIGGFDESFFMYFEDVDFCKRLGDLGKRILFCPSVEVLHWGGKSAENRQAQKKLYYASQRIYLKKHFGTLRSTCIHLLRLLFSA